MKGRFPGTTTGPFFPTQQKAMSNTVPELSPFDITDLTICADYIHSAELVNMRYSHQIVPNAIAAGSPVNRETCATYWHDRSAADSSFPPAFARLLQNK
jgi:hypothetical protein